MQHPQAKPKWSFTKEKILEYRCTLNINNPNGASVSPRCKYGIAKSSYRSRTPDSERDDIGSIIRAKLSDCRGTTQYGLNHLVAESAIVASPSHHLLFTSYSLITATFFSTMMTEPFKVSILLNGNSLRIQFITSFQV